MVHAGCGFILTLSDVPHLEVCLFSRAHNFQTRLNLRSSSFSNINDFAMFSMHMNCPCVFLVSMDCTINFCCLCTNRPSDGLRSWGSYFLALHLLGPGHPCAFLTVGNPPHAHYGALILTEHEVQSSAQRLADSHEVGNTAKPAAQRELPLHARPMPPRSLLVNLKRIFQGSMSRTASLLLRCLR